MGNHLLVINGPNLNLLGERETAIYGTQTLRDINRELARQGESLGLALSFFQSNHEGALIDRVQEARKNSNGLIINPGAYAHTSIALRDALAAYPHPVIEVHLTDIKAREEFRRHSHTAEVATTMICGHGAQGYTMALELLATLLVDTSRTS